MDKMMEQKMKEEQERRKKKEMEERMSLEETKEQIQSCRRSFQLYRRKSTSFSSSSRKLCTRKKNGGERNLRVT